MKTVSIPTNSTGLHKHRLPKFPWWFLKHILQNCIFWYAWLSCEISTLISFSVYFFKSYVSALKIKHTGSVPHCHISPCEHWHMKRDFLLACKLQLCHEDMTPEAQVVSSFLQAEKQRYTTSYINYLQVARLSSLCPVGGCCPTCTQYTCVSVRPASSRKAMPTAAALL